MGYEDRGYIESLAPAWIAEFHLGGFTPEQDEANPGSEVWIDTHATAVKDPAWDLYDYAVRRLRERPTLVEWDNDIPPLATLLGEAARSDEIVASVRETLYAD